MIGIEWLVVNYLPEADTVIVLGKDSRLLQQGSFKDLGLDEHYIESLQLAARPKESDTADPVTDFESEEEIPRSNETIEEENRQTNDLSVYKYYASALGWPKMALLVVFLSMEAGFGAFRCRLSSFISYLLLANKRSLIFRHLAYNMGWKHRHCIRIPPWLLAWSLCVHRSLGSCWPRLRYRLDMEFYYPHDITKTPRSCATSSYEGTNVLPIQYRDRQFSKQI